MKITQLIARYARTIPEPFARYLTVADVGAAHTIASRADTSAELAATLTRHSEYGVRLAALQHRDATAEQYQAAMELPLGKHNRYLFDRVAGAPYDTTSPEAVEHAYQVLYGDRPRYATVNPCEDPQVFHTLVGNDELWAPVAERPWSYSGWLTYQWSRVPAHRVIEVTDRLLAQTPDKLSVTPGAGLLKTILTVCWQLDAERQQQACDWLDADDLWNKRELRNHWLRRPEHDPGAELWCLEATKSLNPAGFDHETVRNASVVLLEAGDPTAVTGAVIAEVVLDAIQAQPSALQTLLTLADDIPTKQERATVRLSDLLDQVGALTSLDMR